MSPVISQQSSPSATSTAAARIISTANLRVLGVKNKEEKDEEEEQQEVEPEIIEPATDFEIPFSPALTICIYINANRIHINSKGVCLNRKKIKPTSTINKNQDVPPELANASSYLVQTEHVTDKFLSSHCSICNYNVNDGEYKSALSTTRNGDQPLMRKSVRYVPLNEDNVVVQKGTYYGTTFIPEKTGRRILWFSHYKKSPRPITAKLCCLLETINSFNGSCSSSSSASSSSNAPGPIEEFQVSSSIFFKKEECCPLQMKWVEQNELDAESPVLVLLMLAL
ncbi:ORF131 [White spot syndrome virus]|uniref:Wsv267 n=3 Tax=White spot syndrome virus TaxID=342409 RepID=Q77J39_WSSVS|nr:wsv267 [Shrimp white spot syndrome virus]YP_009220565.1 hypothetical protein SWSSV_gp091 [White spot syndrome virus]AYW76585.1 hypothetical protein [Procambarus clarkii virus]AAK77800.1 ORF131 [White spot syndrome virus]AAL33270.1 wsv267 [Shrimp white spot syndrome virus]AAL89190.1 WSSV322 [Shrimp white spot syndrome virus]AFX59641.1 wsv267 [White spot syndrome virus]